ncbi:MAG TPA: hypothetical protein VLE94_07125 [Burkholderiaceae bacterium]|nr:hypothetical protein [Burkholderiaceae bacterium]
MNQQQPKRPATPAPREPEVQQGEKHGIVRDERLKQVIKQHPERDEPRVDSIEPGETPAP